MTTATPKKAHAWKRILFGPFIGWLMFHANRRFRTETWYATKDLILDQYGTGDGCDMQVLKPLECWSCKDDITLMGGHRCNACNGSGEYAPERYVRLLRRRIGRYVFHKPGSYATSIGLQYWAKQWQARSVIHGLIVHPQTPRSKALGYHCRTVLELLFDTRRFAPHFLRVVFQRPIRWGREQARTWRFGCHPIQQWPLSPWHRHADWQGLQDDDLPF